MLDLSANLNSLVYVRPENAPQLSSTAAANLYPTTVSSRIAIPLNSAGLPPQRVRLAVSALAAGQEIYFKFGDVTVVAALETDISMGAGATEIFAVPPGATHIAAVEDAGTGQLQIRAVDN